jgi:hypothetical protein
MSPEGTVAVGFGAASLIGTILLFAVPPLLGLAFIVLMIAALVDAIQVPNDSDYRAGTRLVWVLVILLAGFIGAIIYYAVGRPQRHGTATPRTV